MNEDKEISSLAALGSFLVAVVMVILLLFATGCTSTGEPYYTGKITGGSVQNHWGYRKNRQLSRRIYRGERRARGRR